MIASEAVVKNRGGRPRVTIKPEQVHQLRIQGTSWRRTSKALGIGTATAMRLLKSIDGSCEHYLRALHRASGIVRNRNLFCGGRVRLIFMPARFEKVYRMLEAKGPGRAKSHRGTEYKIKAVNGNIVALPRSGRVTIHRDCWLQPQTCQGTRAGGIYNGSYSILDWYADMKNKANR